MTEVLVASTEFIAPVPSQLLVNDETTLVRYTPDDAQLVFDTVEANKAFLRVHEAWAEDFPLEDATQGVKAMSANAEAGKSAPFKIMRDDVYVGSMGMNSRQGTSATMGYWLVEDAQGKGIASMSARRLLKFGFEEWGLTEVRLEIGKQNSRSEQLAKTLGAKLIGPNPDDATKLVWRISKYEQ